ncbi:MAG TPA: metallophosphoesterase [Mobilitalea sp.]|nr:metallophosphoesterase [Mobilitalea sp.]
MQTGYIVLGIIFIFVIWALIEQKQLVTTKYIVTSDKLPKVFDGIHFVVLADLHNYKFGDNNDRLVKRIEQLSPEFLIIAGDMINKRTSCYPSNAFSLLNQLSKKYKIFYAYGNHEQRMEEMLLENKELASQDIYTSWTEYKKILINQGVSFLDNKSTAYIKNKEKLIITGISIERKFFERNNFPAMEEDYLNTILGKRYEGKYQVLIAHNPMYFTNYAKWGADLTISGHLHGGMVRLPGVGGVISPQVKLFPKYNAGNFSENGQQMIVSRGLGSHSYMPRLFNAPEIVTVTLKYEA